MTTHLIDDSPLTRYHKKLIVACSGGPFLDGYLLSIVGVALAGASADLDLDASTLGFAGAVSLVGLFFGSLIFGPVTDRIGRRVMYTADLLVMILASVACLWIDTGWQLIALRFVIGAAVGADYPIATSLLTEWIPKKSRGAIIGLLSVVWLVGAVVAYLVGFALTSVYGPESWRWMLASGAVFGVIVLLLRMGAHESPRWLVAKGRLEEAREHVSDVLGRNVTLEEIATLAADEDSPGPGRFTELLRGDYLRRVVFCGLFWMCFAIPQFALFTYGPIILSHMGFSGDGASETLGQIILNLGFVLGALPGMRWVETRGRRPLILGSFFFGALALVPLGVWPGAPSWFVMVFFFLFTLINSAGNILVFIYPNELFPTQIRASAVGLATAISRVGAAVGTFLVPVSLDTLGTGTTMLIGAAITLLGFVISFFWAEETRNQSLASAAQTTATPADLPIGTTLTGPNGAS
ncbi:Major facilitator superfamily (MFS_1) transporter [Rhodococcus wratislaviensis]|uniref:Major facilitator superfamily (MFS_1) transporter n=1 Tax=Rhodococcus wratislaviensis TaxID=44752 RepID=A0A402BZ87_RHOWR|nr:MFS transporter [Rhodococcus wratislaviensis]GCE36659.1 Major facilitator superfamily (MFS_1) transporter [Rhodococcus wratislaviensis]